MKKNHFYILKLKQLILPFLLIIFTICLVIFSNTNLYAAKSGLLLWANSIVPTLFPFFVATELLSHTNFTYYLGKVLNIFMKPVFNIRGEGSFALIMGIISGYPTGAKISANFRLNNICSKEECERLLSFTNNSGPLFILGTVGISMFGNSTIGILLWISHLLSAITVGIIFRFWKSNIKQSSINSTSYKTSYDNISLSNLGGVIGNSITNSINTILLIGGFVVLFSVIISICNSCNIINIICNIFSPICSFFSVPKELAGALFTGILEITNGINMVCNINLKNISASIIITSFLLGIGGISVFLQVFSIVAKSDLSIKPYIIGKCLQGILASVYTFCFIKFFVIFNFNLY